MPLIDQATLAVGTGHYYTGDVDAPFPTDLLNVPAAAWSEIGHTSIEDIISFDSEGGDASSLGTLQNPTLRTTYSTRTESFAIVLQQFDEASLKLFYGSNAKKDSKTGLMQVPTNPVPTTAGFLAVFRDGQNAFAIYAPKAEIYRGDNFEIKDTESFASLPLSVKPLQSGSNDWTYAITPLKAVTP